MADSHTCSHISSSLSYTCTIDMYTNCHFCVLISVQRYLNFTDDLSEIEFSWKESERAFKVYKEKQVSAKNK